MQGYDLGVQAEPDKSETRLRRVSLEEWIGLPDDESGEWVDGWLVEEEVGSYLHDLVIAWFIATLHGWVVPLRGSVTASNFKFVLGDARGRKPDIAVFLPGHRPSLRTKASDRPPDIAVEVISASASDRRRDRVVKFSEYAKFGIRQYWLVDPEARTLEVFELGTDGRYASALQANEGALTIPGCEGLTLGPDRLVAGGRRSRGGLTPLDQGASASRLNAGRLSDSGRD